MTVRLPAVFPLMTVRLPAVFLLMTVRLPWASIPSPSGFPGLLFLVRQASRGPPLMTCQASRGPPLMTRQAVQGGVVYPRWCRRSGVPAGGTGPYYPALCILPCTTRVLLPCPVYTQMLTRVRHERCVYCLELGSGRSGPGTAGKPGPADGII